MEVLALPLTLALLLATLLSPVVIRVAHWVQFVDRPDGNRKQQSTPTALGGGIVVYAAVIATMCLVYPGMAFSAEKVEPLPMPLLLVAATIILLAGVADDRYGLRGVHKLILQMLAASVGAFCLGFERLDILGFGLELGSLKFVAAAFWMLCCINAFNLIDGADGVAATLGSVISLTLGVIAIINGKPEAAVLPLALSGALAGFLVHNAPPAKIYLGDSGSMLVGLIVGIVAMHASVKSQATFAIGAPMALLAIPIADTGFAIFRRKFTGRSIYETDRGHIHHCLLFYGASPRQLVTIVALVSTVVSGITIASIVFQFDLLLLTVFATLLFVLVQLKIFGHGEFRLLLSRLQSWIRSDATGQTDSIAVNLQGHRDWSQPWNQILTFCRDNELVAAQFSVNIPRLHDSFYGRWGNNQAFSNRQYWQISVPLNQNGEHIGYIELSGQRSPSKSTSQFCDLTVGANQLANHVMEMVTNVTSDSGKAIVTVPPVTLPFEPETMSQL